MKVCLLGPTHPFRGGISHYTTFLYLELKKKHDVHFISLSRQYPSFLFPGKTQFDLSQQHVSVENRPLLDPVNPLSWIKTAQAIKKLSPDILVIQWWHPFFALSFAAVSSMVSRLGKIKVCFLCHNVMPHDQTIFDRMLSGVAFRSARFFIVQSKQDEKTLRRMRPSVSIDRIAHPTYEEFARLGGPTEAEARKKLGTGQMKVILFFGYVRPYKGLSYLLQAMPQVLRSIDCTLLVVGEFYENSEKYQDEIRGLGLDQKVKIINRYVPNEEVSLYFRAADVVVLPYISATQSGVVQMAYGFDKPVITTHTGGLPEVVREGITGYVVPPKDAGAIAQAIITFYKKNSEGELSRNVSKYKKEFSWSIAREAIERIAPHS